jgi:hypothetical protein
MGRKPRIRVNAPLDKNAVILDARVDTEALRILDDDSRLREILAFGQSLAAWVAQFDRKSPATLLAAGSIGIHGIDAALTYVQDELVRLVPYSGKRPPAGGTSDSMPLADDAKTLPGRRPARKDWMEARRQLSKTLNTFTFLREHVAGHLRSEPELRYPYDGSPDDVPWNVSWQPADEETEVVARARFPRLWKEESLQRGQDGVQRTHDRIAGEGRSELRRFIEDMESDERAEGFPRVRELIADMQGGKEKTTAKRSLKKFALLTHALSELVPNTLPGDTTPFGKPYQEFFAVNLAERFVEAGRDYVELCLPLLGRPRGSLQADRKKVLRRIALVAQYAFLASGNGWLRRFNELLTAVDIFAEDLQKDVALLLDTPSAKRKADANEVHRVVRKLNTLVVDPGALKRWQAATKARAAFYGKVIGVIVNSEAGQITPWARGDVVPALSHAGLITAKGKNGRGKSQAVTDALFVMQQAGLAVQVPLTHLVDGGSRPKRKRKQKGKAVFAADGLPWIVNPLGAVLAEHGDATEAGQVRKRKPRKNAKTEARETRQTRTVRLDKSKHKRSSVAAKAAKKWPRA